ncbi:hypothetical protein Gpo141_00007603 [Globisporangium polare]
MQFYGAEPQQVLTVLAAADGHAKDPYAVRRVCTELSRLVLADSKLRLQMIADELLLPTLVAAVAEHVDEQALLLADCCRFLRRTISLRVPSPELDIQTRIVETGILKLLVRGLQCHPHSTALFSEACRLVALLCFDLPLAPHADNQADMNASGLLRVICERLSSGENCVTELEAQLGVEAIAAVLYENERNAEDAVDTLRVLVLFSRLLQRFSHSSRLGQSVTQSLFQILTLQPMAHGEVLEQGLVEQVVILLEGDTAAASSSSSSSLALWHSFKCLELAVRQNEDAKDGLCACRGPSVMLRAMESAAQASGSKASAHTARQQSPALRYIVCMLFCRLAVSGEPPVPHKTRIEALMLCGAHEFALDVVKNCTGSGSQLHYVLAQAIRMLELIAAIETNRIPLTRLGASRAVKLVWNSPTATPKLQILCERAIAAIEGT